MLHITAGEFRCTYDGERMLERFRRELVLPNVDVLRETSSARGASGNARRPAAAIAMAASMQGSAVSLRARRHAREDFRRARERDHGESRGVQRFAAAFLAIDDRENSLHHSAGCAHGLDGAQR